MCFRRGPWVCSTISPPGVPYAQPSLSLFLILVFPLSSTNTVAFGQSPTPDTGLYCTAGLQPDGYIDFSGLPPAPNINPQPGQPAPSQPVTATLPVIGVPGLTAAVTISALNPFSGVTVPAYSVDGGTLHLNGLGSPLLTLNFNQPIMGVGLNTETTGRFTYNYTLQIGVPGDTPPIFATTANGYTLALYSPQAQSLQFRATDIDGAFSEASLQFSGSEYSNLTISNLRVQSSVAPDPAKAVPTDGLEQWLRADTANFVTPGIWQDQSGQGHDATPSTNPPVFTVDGRNCRPTFQFTGNQYFSFNLPISGWSQMTVFLVAKAGIDGATGAYSQNSAILWTENARWGNTFVSPYQTHAYARFGTTQTNNEIAHTRPGGGIGQDFSITRAVHNEGVDSLYVNGIRVFRQSGKLPVLGGVTGAGTIGEGINNTYFNGEISEILVYDRVLSNNEAAVVENYLAQKYGTH